jgi:prepilin-type N-terminal cleavage/methylation domain-containing protein
MRQHEAHRAATIGARCLFCATKPVALLAMTTANNRISFASPTALSVRAPCRTWLGRLSPVRVRQGGFTVIEMLVVLVILLVLATMAAPHFGHLLSRQKLNVASNDLYAVLTVARNESIMRGRLVSACPVTSTQATSCDTSGDWTKAKAVLITSPSASGTPPPALRVVEPSGAEIKVNLDVAADSVDFSPYAALATGTVFTLCHPDLDEGRQITVPRFGMPTMKTISMTGVTC